jgi:hypothetical protein
MRDHDCDHTGDDASAASRRAVRTALVLRFDSGEEERALRFVARPWEHCRSDRGRARGELSLIAGTRFAPCSGMNLLRQIVPLGTFLVVGCAASHDAGHDASGGSCADAGPVMACVVASADHTCGDWVRPASCEAERWVCPAGSVLQSEADCWCVGPAGPSCTCTPSGWSCEDAGAEGTREVTCGGETCGTGEYCIVGCTGVDAGVPAPDRCAPLPRTDCDVSEPCSCFCAGDGLCNERYEGSSRRVQCSCA